MLTKAAQHRCVLRAAHCCSNREAHGCCHPGSALVAFSWMVAMGKSWLRNQRIALLRPSAVRPPAFHVRHCASDLCGRSPYSTERLTQISESNFAKSNVFANGLMNDLPSSAPAEAIAACSVRTPSMEGAPATLLQAGCGNFCFGSVWAASAPWKGDG